MKNVNAHHFIKQLYHRFVKCYSYLNRNKGKIQFKTSVNVNSKQYKTPTSNLQFSYLHQGFYI